MAIRLTPNVETALASGSTTTEKAENISASIGANHYVKVYKNGSAIGSSAVQTSAPVVVEDRIEVQAISVTPSADADIDVDTVVVRIENTAGTDYIEADVSTTEDPIAGTDLTSGTAFNLGPFIFTQASGTSTVDTPLLDLNWKDSSLSHTATYNTPENYEWRGYDGYRKYRTADTDVPHHLSPITGKKGLLIMSDAENLVAYSDAMTAGWTNSGLATIGNATGPDNVSNSAHTLTNTSANYLAHTHTGTAGAHTWASLYIKKGTAARYMYFLVSAGPYANGYRCWVDLDTMTLGTTGTFGTGTFTDAWLEPYMDGWYRLVIGGIVDASSTSILASFSLVTANGGTTPVSDSSTMNWATMHVQESASNLPPLASIKTSGAAATRDAYAPYIITSGLTTGGSCSVEYEMEYSQDAAGDYGPSFLTIDNNSTGETISVFQFTNGTTARVYLEQGATTQDVLDFSAIDPEDYNTFSFSYDAVAGISGALNGSFVQNTGLGLTVPNVSYIRFGHRLVSGVAEGVINGIIGRIRCWGETGTLTTAQLEYTSINSSNTTVTTPSTPPSGDITEDAAVIWFDPSIPFDEWTTDKRGTRLQISGRSSDTYPIYQFLDGNGDSTGSDGVARILRVDQGGGRYALRFRLFKGEAYAFGSTWRAHIRATGSTNQRVFHNTPMVAAWAVKPWAIQTVGNVGGFTRSFYGLSGGQDGDQADNSPAVVRHSTNNVAAVHLRYNAIAPHLVSNDSPFSPDGDWYGSFAGKTMYFVAEYVPGWASECYYKLYMSTDGVNYSQVLNWGQNGYRATNPANDYEFYSFGVYFWDTNPDLIWGAGAANGTIQQYDTSGLFVFKQELLPSGWTIQDMFDFLYARFQ